MSFRNKILISLLTVFACMVFMPAQADTQTPSNFEHLIGIVNHSKGMKEATDGFNKGMSEFCYMEGKNTQ